MKHQLNADKRYSPLECAVFALFPANGEPLTTTMIAGKIYGRKPNATARALSVLRGLQAKVRRYREPFRIAKTARRGPHPVTWSVEPTKK